MDLSVVVPTLNGRDHLAECLDALAAHAPEAEVVVINGPSTDGTSGFVRDHRAVDRLLELPERNRNVARNAGLRAATGDALALVGQGSAVEEGWTEAVREGLAAAAAVTGPVHRAISGGLTTGSRDSRSVAGRELVLFDGRNVAFTRQAVEALDGFDEYLAVEGARDAAHRLAGLDLDVAWRPEMAVLRTGEQDVTDRTIRDPRDACWGLRYRETAYSLVKNYGPRPAALGRLAARAGRDGADVLRDVLGGEATPSTWLGDGRDVCLGCLRGIAAGLRARRADSSPARNPNGLSEHSERPITTP
jgi:glycosyltransferase involved in cell wall biosynthesis